MAKKSKVGRVTQEQLLAIAITEYAKRYYTTKEQMRTFPAELAPASTHEVNKATLENLLAMFENETGEPYGAEIEW